MPRWVKWLASMLVIASMASCFAFTFSETRIPVPVSVATIEAALSEPISAPGASLPVVDRGVLPVVDGGARVDVTVPARECVFAVAGAATPEPFVTITLRDTGTDEPLAGLYDSRTTALGWCAAGEPLSVTLTVRARMIHDERDLTADGEGYLVYRLHVGPPDERWQAYLTGSLFREPLEALTAGRDEEAGELRDEQTAPTGTPLFRADLEPETALALPLSEATRWTAQAMGTVGLPDATYAPRLEGARGGTAGSESPYVVIDDQHERLLAVVDPSDLPVEGPVPCVRLHFTRLGAEARQATRRPVPSMDGGADTVHRLCPGDPLTAFTTPISDGETWRLRVLPAEAGSAPRRASAIPTEPLVGPAHRVALASCDEGDAQACTDAAQQLATGRFVVPDASRALRLAERACRTEATECGVHGDLLQAEGDGSGAFRAWLRGCNDGDDGWSCAALGEAYRLGDGHPFDGTSALEAYQKACDLDVQDACTRIETMALLEIGG